MYSSLDLSVFLSTNAIMKNNLWLLLKKMLHSHDQTYVAVQNDRQSVY